MNLHRAVEDSTQVSPILTPDVSPNPAISNSSTLSSTAKKKKINYDGVYHTNEPLKDRPDIVWDDKDDKDWDVFSSPEGSEIDSPKRTTAEPEFYPEYEFVEEFQGPAMSRAAAADSGLGVEHEKRPYSAFVPKQDDSDEEDTPNPTLSKSQPVLNYADDDYATVNKDNKSKPYKRNQSVSSMSSRITAV